MKTTNTVKKLEDVFNARHPAISLSGLSLWLEGLFKRKIDTIIAIGTYSVSRCNNTMRSHMDYVIPQTFLKH
jgi:hypothetical protein